MKFLIETGNESHTSSYARVQAKYHGGAFDGKYLYEVKAAQVSAQWDPKNNKHKQWVTTVYELPEGTEITIECKAYDGDVHRIYRLDACAEVLEMSLTHIGGVGRGDVKGRLVLVRDLLAEKAQSLKQSQQEGF